MICAVDLGGTKVKIALFDREQPTRVRETATYASASYKSFDDLIMAFLQPRKLKLQALAVGVAGPITGDRADVTNLNWRLHAPSLAALVDCSEVYLLNDLEAHAWGIGSLSADGLKTLRKGVAKVGNQALIAAGTGLGESILCWTGQEYWPRASEGGHCNFAPSTERDVELLRFLWRSYPTVSWERVVSGSFGFRHLYQFLLSKPEWAAQVRVPLNGNLEYGPQLADAARQQDPVAIETMRWFMSLYGSEAGNLALKALAVGGLYVAGGICTHLQDFMVAGEFATAFANKGRFQKMLDEIPIHIITDTDCALKGAARYAHRHLLKR